MGETGFLGGQQGALLLLQLASVSALGCAAAAALRRAPESLQPRLPDLVFGVALLCQLLALLRLSLQPLDVDVDTAQHAAALQTVHGLGDVIRLRGVWAADYILQGPLVHGLARILAWEPVAVYRLLAYAGATATALLLRAVARRLGAGPWAAALAGLFPLCTFGGAWLILTLDDNAFASALQWAFFFALLAALTAPDAAAGKARRWARVLGAGLLLGLAVSMHRKATLWAGIVPLAPLLSARFRSARALRELALVALAAAISHGLAAGLFLPSGFSSETLPLLVSSAHHQHTVWWLPAADLTLGDHATAVWRGLHATFVSFPVLREEMLRTRGIHYFDVLVGLCVAAGLAAAWRTRHSPGCRLLATGLGIQSLHSVLYEPLNVERWDMLAGGVGVLVAVAVSGAPRAWSWAALCLWLTLLATQHLTLRWHPNHVARQAQVRASVDTAIDAGAHAGVPRRWRAC